MSSEDYKSRCDSDTDTTGCLVISNYGIAVNNWNHVVATKENRLVKFYIDGYFKDQHNLPISTILYNGESDYRYIGTGKETYGWSGNS